MSKAPRRPPTPSHAGGVMKQEDELPVVECLGITKVAKGWVVVELSVQGDKVLERSVISRDPEPRADAMRRLVKETLGLLAPRAGVSA